MWCFLAVAKALRRVTEGKASAQAEAAEWKHKYELAKSQNLQLEQRGYFSLSSTTVNIQIMVLSKLGF